MYEIPAKAGTLTCTATGWDHPTDSALERSYGRYLNSCGEAWIRPAPYRFGGTVYTPDYRTRSAAGLDVFVEIKPPEFLQECPEKIPRLLQRMLAIRGFHPRAALALVPWAEGWTWPRAWRFENSGPGRPWEHVSPAGERQLWTGGE